MDQIPAKQMVWMEVQINVLTASERQAREVNTYLNIIVTQLEKELTKIDFRKVKDRIPFLRIANRRWRNKTLGISPDIWLPTIIEESVNEVY